MSEHAGLGYFGLVQAAFSSDWAAALWSSSGFLIFATLCVFLTWSGLPKSGPGLKELFAVLVIRAFAAIFAVAAIFCVPSFDGVKLKSQYVGPLAHEIYTEQMASMASPFELIRFKPNAEEIEQFAQQIPKDEPITIHEIREVIEIVFLKCKAGMQKQTVDSLVGKEMSRSDILVAIQSVDAMCHSLAPKEVIDKKLLATRKKGFHILRFLADSMSV